MIVNVPTKIIPIWFIEQWKKENAEPESPLDFFIDQLIKDWKLEEIRQSKWFNGWREKENDGKDKGK